MPFPTALLMARGTAIVLVLLFHAHIFLFAKGLGFEPYWKIVNLLTYMLMPLLFLLSGLSMPFLVASRAAIYLYLYLLWTIIHFCCEVIFEYRLTNVRLENFTELFTSFFIPDSILWFLYALLIYILLARTISRMSLHSQLAISVIMAGFVEFIDLHYAARAIIQNFFFFLVGLHYRTQLTEFFSRDAKLGFLTTSSLYCLIFLGARWVGLARAPLLNEVLGLLGVAAALFACRLVALTPLRPVLRMVGRHTLQIYLLHLIFFEALWFAFSLTSLSQPQLTGIFGPPVATALALIGSIAATRMLRKVPGLFTAPEWALRILTPPLERLVDVASMPGFGSGQSSATKLPPRASP
jgi:fucose 4-O-acetylase-like acetyltransferase